MSCDNGRTFGMQNPGDLRVPEGVVIKPSKRTLLLNGKAVLVDRSRYDQVIDLYPDGQPSLEDEQSVIDDTTL